MELKNEIFMNGFLQAFATLSNIRGLPAIPKWKLTKFRKELKKQSDIFEETRRSLVEEYGEKIKDGRNKGEKAVTARSPRYKEFGEEIEKLITIKSVYPDTNLIYEELGEKMESINVKELELLSPLFKDSEEKWVSRKEEGMSKKVK